MWLKSNLCSRSFDLISMNIFHRVWDSLGFGDRYDDREYEYDYEEEVSPDFYGPEAMYPPDRQSHPLNQASSNVIGLPNRQPTQEILLLEPRSFEEMPQVVSALRERKAVILNLALLDPDMAQRCVDFVAGGAFAIDGHQERLGENIFLFTPNYVHISSQTSAHQQVIQSVPASPRPTPSAPTIVWPMEQPNNYQ